MIVKASRKVIGALSPALSPPVGGRGAAFVCALGGMVLARRLRRDRERSDGASSSPSENAIERNAEKGPVKLFVRVCAARAAAVGSGGNGRHGRVAARRRDQTAGVRAGRGRLSRSRLQRAARRGGCGERAPIPLSVGAGARRQAPDPVGVDRIRGQTPEFGTARVSRP